MLVPAGTSLFITQISFILTNTDTSFFAYSPPTRNGPELIYRSPEPRRPRQNPDFVEESSDSDSGFGLKMGGYPPRGMEGYGGKRADMGFTWMGSRPSSAPEMLMTYPGMGMGMGMMGSPRMGGRRMGMPIGMPGPRMGGRGMGIGMPSPRMNAMGMNGMGRMGMPPAGMPPEYNPMPPMPRYSNIDGATPDIPPNPYAYTPPPPPSSPPTKSPSSSPPASLQPQPRHLGRPPSLHKHIPMAAYTPPTKPKHTHTEPQISTKLNRNQFTNRKVGPSSHEWLDGDSFLDACVCTTNCTCRKGHRVLYRSRDDPCDDDVKGEKRYRSGEIRYIFKEDLGRDCGDHEACKEKNREKSSDDESARRKSRKERKKEKQQQFEGFKEELLEALDERFEEMRKSQEPVQWRGRFPAEFGGFYHQRASPFVVGEEGGNIGIDPRMAQRRGMDTDMATDPYGVNIDMTGMGMHGRSKPPPNMGLHNPPSAMGGMNTLPGMTRSQFMSSPFPDNASISDTSGMQNPSPYTPYQGRPSFPSPQPQKPTPDYRGTKHMHRSQNAYQTQGEDGFGIGPARRWMGRWDEEEEDEDDGEEGMELTWRGMNRTSHPS